MAGFTSPAWLLVIVAVAALAIGYGWIQRRRHRYALRFANLAVLDQVAGRTPGRWRRRGPPALLAFAMLVLSVGLAGPTAIGQVPRNRATVMLVIDVSLSMGAKDIQPTRIAAAEDAATQFVHELPAGINLGVESFAASPIVLASPSTDRQPALAAIHDLKLAAATNTGGALQAALAAIAAFTATIPGSDQGPPPARIVLESDGKQTIGPSEFPIATQAGRQHIPINTISFGTTNGTVTIDGQQQPVPVDDASLAQVAHLSGGEFFSAETSAAAHQVYDTLGHQLGYETARVDVSKPWLATGTLAVILATALALGFTQRLPA